MWVICKVSLFDTCFSGAAGGAGGQVEGYWTTVWAIYSHWMAALNVNEQLSKYITVQMNAILNTKRITDR